MPRYSEKHHFDKQRCPSYTTCRLVKVIANSVIVGTIVGTSILLAVPAQAASESTRYPLAESESEGDRNTVQAAPFRFDKPGTTCVVLPGDTLTTVAHRYLIAGGWQEIYYRNAEIISDPDVIYPGQRLTLR